MELQKLHNIGSHMPKLKTIVATVESVKDMKAAQVFLGNPLNTKFTLKDADMDSANGLLKTLDTHLFVHSQYVINLCAEGAAQPLINNLVHAVRIGCRGVVVHVGKSVKRPLPDAMATMRLNLETALASATETCPILLETPAGQGTETLTKYRDFVDFVLSFKDPRIRICVDTCHVFAAGLEPLKYIQDLIAEAPDALKLVHFNDSKGSLGCCVDRHAFIGEGDIGLVKLTAVAELCTEHKIPMVIE